jgi:DNA-binding NarL/FixJ family response regulator
LSRRPIVKVRVLPDAGSAPVIFDSSALAQSGSRLRPLMTQTAKIARVLLADDHVPVLAQTMNLLAGEFEIAGSVGNGLDLVDAAARLDPDVVVLDITMPGCDGIEAARRLKRASCHAHLVFLTVHEDADYIRAALDAGGEACVAKSRMASDLIPAIHAALAGQGVASPDPDQDTKA